MRYLKESWRNDAIGASTTMSASPRTDAVIGCMGNIRKILQDRDEHEMALMELVSTKPDVKWKKVGRYRLFWKEQEKSRLD